MIFCKNHSHTYFSKWRIEVYDVDLLLSRLLRSRNCQHCPRVVPLRTNNLHSGVDEDRIWNNNTQGVTSTTCGHPAVTSTTCGHSAGTFPTCGHPAVTSTTCGHSAVTSTTCGHPAVTSTTRGHSAGSSDLHYTWSLCGQQWPPLHVVTLRAAETSTTRGHSTGSSDLHYTWSLYGQQWGHCCPQSDHM